MIYVCVYICIMNYRDSAVLPSGLTRLEIQVAAQFDDHACTVWRVCWNVTGTILASSGDDGCVRLWKSKFMCLTYTVFTM